MMAEADIATEQIVRCPQCRYADGEHSIGCLHNEVMTDGRYADNTVLENSESSQSEDEDNKSSDVSEDSEEKEDVKGAEEDISEASSSDSQSSADGSEVSDNEQMQESPSNHFEELDQADDSVENETSSVNCISLEVSEGADSVNHTDYDRDELIEFKTSIQELENEDCDNSRNQSDDETRDDESLLQNGTIQPDSMSFSGEYPDDSCSGELTEKDFNMFPDEHGIYKCTQEDCDYNTVVFRYFKRHIKKHTSNTLECPFCNYTSPVKYHMNRHVSSHISSGSTGCPHCPFKSVRADMLRKHIKLHENANSLLACNQCSYTTHEFQRFETHLQMHKGRAVFACTECTYSTLRKGHYNRHMSRHTRKPLKCPLCSFTTTHRFQMQKHKENHKKQGEHIYFCNKCDYIAEKISRLKSHMLTHRSVCPVCSKAFSSDLLFKEHITNHLKEFGTKQSNDDSGAHSDESETLDSKNVVQSLLKNILNRKQEEEEEEVVVKVEEESYSSDEEITKDEPKISDVKSQQKPIAKLKINLKSLFASKSSISHKFDSEADDEVESYGSMGMKRSNSDEEEVDSSPPKKMKVAPMDTSYKSGYCTNGKIGIFNCLLCTFSTTTKKYLNRHLRRHDKSECVVCPVCLITTCSIEMLLSHISIHSNEAEEYECEECGNCCHNAEEFIHHMSQHNAVNSLNNGNGKPLKADAPIGRVQEPMDDKNALQEFLAKHTDFSVEPVKTHPEEEEQPAPQTVHDETPPQAEDLLHRLELLKKLNLLSGEQKEHETLDEDSGYHPCTQCSYVALKKENLLKHVAQHTGKGMLYCPHCSYSTIRKEHMKRHVKLHTEGVLKCDKCEYETRRKEQFRMHLNSHLHDDHLKCPFCLYISIKRKDMKRHIARHTQEKVSKCPFCQYSSDRRERMKKHVFTCHSNLIENDNGLSWWRAQSEPSNENTTVEESPEEVVQNGTPEEEMEADDGYDYAMNFVSTCMEEESKDELVATEKADTSSPAVVESSHCFDSEEDIPSDSESLSQKSSAAIKMAAIIQLVNAASQSKDSDETEKKSVPEGEAPERLLRAKAQQVLLDQHIKLIRYEILKLLQDAANKEQYEMHQMLLNFQAMLRQTQVLYKLVEKEIESCSKEIAEHNFPAPPPLKSKSHVPKPPESIPCPLCDFSATWNDELIGHIRACHTPAVPVTSKAASAVEKARPPPVKKFMRCNSCKYTTFRSYHMRRHIGRKHAGRALDDYHDLPESESSLKSGVVYSDTSLMEESASE